MKELKMKAKFYISIFYLPTFGVVNTPVSLAQTIDTVYSIISDSDYKAYLHTAVNNTHYVTIDDSNRIYFIHTDQAGDMHLKTKLNGNWNDDLIFDATSGSSLKSPSIFWLKGKLHAGWIEIDDSNARLVYAKGTPSGASGNFDWEVSTLSSLPQDSLPGMPKYPTMILPDTNFNPLFGFTIGGAGSDIEARVYNSFEQSVISPLRSNLGTWEKSSDLTIAADSNVVIVVWEEDWTVAIPKARLVFAISTDGGETWGAAKNLLDTGPTLGGDPCVAISNGNFYVVFHKPLIGNSSNIMAARMLAGAENFELMDLSTDELGKVGKGWLPNIDICNSFPDRLVISWERTDGRYFDKWEHRVASASITNATGTPQFALGPETISSPSDTSNYELNSNVIIHPDGEKGSLFWVSVHEQSASVVTLTFCNQEFVLPIATNIKNNSTLTFKDFTLHQNYPNPFNPSTVISYRLSASSNVSLKIFDVLGNEVATLIDNEFKEAGFYNYKLSPDASGFNYQLPSGVYFYRLRAGEYTQTRKMLLTK